MTEKKTTRKSRSTKKGIKNDSMTVLNKKVVTSKSPKSNGVKYRMTFLSNASFQGKIYEKGTVLEVDEWVKKAYSTRTVLEFIPL